MEIKEETKWLCEHARSLEKFSGKWVMFSVNEGIVNSGFSLDKILKSSRKIDRGDRPFVLHVPSKKELTSPFVVARKK